MVIFAAKDLTPLYLQIAAWLEVEILSGNIRTDERIYSQYQLAEMFNVNPATAARGLNILAKRDLLYKKRGLGMFVSPAAPELIQKKRREEKLAQLVTDLVKEARILSISEAELEAMIKAAQNQMGEGEK